MTFVRENYLDEVLDALDFEELDLDEVDLLLTFFVVLEEPQFFDELLFEQLLVVLFSVFVFLFLPNIFSPPACKFTLQCYIVYFIIKYTNKF